MGRSTVAVVATLAFLTGFGQSGATAQEVAWSTDLRSAWQTAQKADRPLLLFVTSSHCPYCRKMKSDTLANPAVARRVHDSYVGVIVDTKNSAEMTARLRIISVPTTLLVLPDGRIADRVEGYVSPNKLLARLESVVRGMEQP